MRATTNRITVSTLLLLLCLASQTLAQTATTATITGLVTDAQGAAVAGASATLTDKATGQERTVVTDAEGKYAFSNLNAGTYDLKITATGFGPKTFADIKADVTKTITQDVALEIGAVTEQVVVTAGEQALLLDQDATIGNTIESRRITTLPNINRDVTELLALQPGIAPTGEATGARSDQSTLALDGIDVTDQNLGQAFRSVIPTPNDAIEEFRVSTSNPNATFGRSSGAQAVFVTKRGGNDWHGSFYEYHRNSALNANTWHNNRTGVPRAFLIDNRFGGSVSGPVLKDRTFFFLLLEGRRSVSSTTATRLVPTATLKQGLLRFRDATGAVQTIDPQTFDPRGLGASPAVLQLLNLFPAPNDPSQGDGLNTAGLTRNIPTSQNSELGILRVDHAFNDRWNFDGSFKAFREIQTLAGNATQVDIANGRTTAISPQRPRSLSLGLTGVLASNITNEVRVGWVHDRLENNREAPQPQVPGANIALDLAGALLDEPVDVDTQRTRTQARTMNTYQFIDNLTWTKNAHTIQAGFNMRHINSFDLRVDKVVGSIATPVAALGSVANNVIPAAQRPAFLAAGDVARYNQLYAALLGQVETITYLSTRNGELQPNAIGTPLITNSTLNAYEFYGADNWRVTPTLTVSYGVMYSWQKPPIEDEGKQTVAVFQGTNELIDPKDYLRQKFDAAARGEIFNPDIAYIPINEANRSGVFDVDWSNISPRISVAWSPSRSGGILGRLLGQGETVLRGGYSLLYDRQNTVQTITIPTLGVGFAQTVAINNALNASGQRFRAGVDGPLPLPAPTSATSPIIPAKPFGETLSFVVDPFSTVPRSHTINFTVQRSLPGRMVLEVGYAGRLGRNLYQSLNLNQVPYNFKDNASGQTFAEAFDALAAQIRGGTAASAVTAQPWFENLLVNLAPENGSRTRALAARQTANIINGNLNNLFVGAIDVFAA
ncbi:MAG TPA: carboxypeptidase regulatory-like domain-containing protein, partial [Pyrinomonadaceae bacterium]|nr:carboxypeptidase regulatory-like domain-containing protein [Pyrinomonadaceae bacterium]